MILLRNNTPPNVNSIFDDGEDDALEVDGKETWDGSQTAMALEMTRPCEDAARVVPMHTVRPLLFWLAVNRKWTSGL